MKLFEKLAFILGIVVTIFTLGCATTGTTSQGTSSSPGSNIDVENSSKTLADHLRRLSGVTIQGVGDNIRVYVRGVSSFAGRNQPLFVVDGSRAGTSYQEVVNRVDVNDIENIRVIKGAEAGSRYGLKGSNGVIEITTKRN